MKKNLIALLLVSMMTVTSVMAAEATNSVSKWLDNASSKVSQTEKSITAKTDAKKQELEAKKKANARAKAQKKADFDKKVADQKKANEEASAARKQKVEEKKKLWKQLISE